MQYFSNIWKVNSVSAITILKFSTAKSYIDRGKIGLTRFRSICIRLAVTFRSIQDTGLLLLDSFLEKNSFHNLRNFGDRISVGFQEVHLGRDFPCAVHLLLLGQPGDRRPAGVVWVNVAGATKKTANWAQATRNGQAIV